MVSQYIAVDLGASSGRILLGRWDGIRFELEEIHRFANAPVNVLGHWHTDILYLWREIQHGLARSASLATEPIAGLGVDTWGVDFALLDKAGRLLGNPYHYRDSRTDGVMEMVFQHVARAEIFERTGIQFIPFNTLYQVYSMAAAGDTILAAADLLLMLPDLLNFWLTGRKVSEYTIASTSQMLDARERRWAVAMLERLSIPGRILPPVVEPGTVLGELRPEVIQETGMRQPVQVIATGSHDTASAVAAVPELDGRSAYISSGTWSLVGVEIPQPLMDKQALRLNFTNEGGVAGTIRLLRNVAGLWLLQESQRQWQREGRTYSVEELLAMADRAEPLHSLVDPDSADFLRPGDMPAAIRDYCLRTGQAPPEDAGATVRCCLESIALKYRKVVGDLEALIGHRLEVIRIVGGGSLNRTLSQFTADACERPVVAGPVEATALGNLMVQAIAMGDLPDLAAGRRALAAAANRQIYEPRPAAAWQEAYARFTKLLDLES